MIILIIKMSDSEKKMIILTGKDNGIRKTSRINAGTAEEDVENAGSICGICRFIFL